MSATVVKDHREEVRTIARFLDEHKEVPKPPSPAWCLIIEGKMVTTFTLGQERDLLEAYFRTR
jgi:hypothetical protein